MAAWQPARLTPAQLEERRREAARLLKVGQRSEAEIARALGVSRQSVNRWKGLLDEAGLHALLQRPHPGRPSKLSGDEWEALLRILKRGALAAGFATERWTLSRIAEVIRREFGIGYHPRSLGPALRARGFTPQRPITRARERDEALIQAWLAQDWPRIKRGLGEQGAPSPSARRVALWTRPVTRSAPA